MGPIKRITLLGIVGVVAPTYRFGFLVGRPYEAAEKANNIGSLAFMGNCHAIALSPPISCYASERVLHLFYRLYHR
jgi:hypothetical protein